MWSRFVYRTFVFVAGLSSLWGSQQAFAINYAETNKNFDTFSINDKGWDSDPKNTALYAMFNQYFKDEIAALGVTNYTSSDQLYQARGVKDAGPWATSSDSQLHSAFKYADFEHTFSIVPTDGGSEQPIRFFSAGLLAPGFVNIQDPIGAYESVDFKLSYAWPNDRKNVNGSYSSNLADNSDQMVHMVAFDVTDLMQKRYGETEIKSAYMLGWEDMWRADFRTDYDYQDLAVVLVNVAPHSSSYEVPEPTSLLALAMAAPILLARRHRCRFESSKN